MNALATVIGRLWGSAVTWSWAFNGLRLASNFILLPVLLRVLGDSNDFGFYWVLASLSVVMSQLDFGFSISLDRAISYAMAGASELRQEGIAGPESNHGSPNLLLLRKLMFTTRDVYRVLALLSALIMGSWGTYVTHLKVGETSHPNLTWAAWGLTLLCGIFEMYSGWWNVYLRGINQVLVGSRILVFGFALRLALSLGLLFAGAGLMSVPLSNFLSSLLQRLMSRHFVLRFLSAAPQQEFSRAERLEVFRTIWPNSWKVGLHCVGYYLVPHANTILCTTWLGLAATAEYGFTMQIVTILQGMASVWVQVKWPIIGQLLTKHEFPTLQKLFRQRLLLQLGSFALMSVATVLLAPPVLSLLHISKTMLPTSWLIVLLIFGLLDMHAISWVTLISLGNRLPFIWYTTTSYAIGIVVAYLLLVNTSLGVGALVLSPLLVQSAYNFWRWPAVGAAMMRTTWGRLLFG